MKITITKHEKPDGIIETAHSSCCCPPGEKRDGVHTRGFTFWWRILFRDETKTAWKLGNIVETDWLAKKCDTCARFRAAMEREFPE